MFRPVDPDAASDACRTGVAIRGPGALRRLTPIKSPPRPLCRIAAIKILPVRMPARAILREIAAMLVEAIMTTPVISVAPSTSIRDAARLMLARRISGLPVVADDGAWSAWSAKEISCGAASSERSASARGGSNSGRTRPVADDYVHANGRKVGEVHVEQYREPTRRDATLDEVVESMSRPPDQAAPVVENGKLVGSSHAPTCCAPWADALPAADAACRRR